MSDFQDRISDEQLELYLDGQLTETEHAEFEARLAKDPRTQGLIETQLDFDAKLRESFSPTELSPEQIEQVLEDSNPTVPLEPNRRRLLVLVASAIAATIAWFAVAIQWDDGARDVEPFFEQRPLVKLYAEAVEQGFRPYYFCEDEDRFALTFLKRQNVPLILETTPDDRRMIGLSYVGGLSRDTTAMLAYVEEKPVVVFVDRNDFDNRDLATELGASQLQVHRLELGELVVYEVSPFDALKMAPYLKIGSDSNSDDEIN